MPLRIDHRMNLEAVVHAFPGSEKHEPIKVFLSDAAGKRSRTRQPKRPNRSLENWMNRQVVHAAYNPRRRQGKRSHDKKKAPDGRDLEWREREAAFVLDGWRPTSIMEGLEEYFAADASLKKHFGVALAACVFERPFLFTQPEKISAATAIKREIYMLLSLHYKIQIQTKLTVGIARCVTLPRDAKNFQTMYADAVARLMHAFATRLNAAFNPSDHQLVELPQQPREQDIENDEDAS